MRITPTPIKLSALDLVATERLRQQLEEGYSKSHDVGYYGNNNDLAQAAACYLLPTQNVSKTSNRDVIDFEIDTIAVENLEKIGIVRWPWDIKFYKRCPDDRLRELVKAGALVLAAIDVELSKQKEEPKVEEVKAVEIDPDICPTCGSKAESRCRCLIGSRVCKCGFEWYVKDGKIFEGNGHDPKKPPVEFKRENHVKNRYA